MLLNPLNALGGSSGFLGGGAATGRPQRPGFDRDALRALDGDPTALQNMIAAHQSQMMSYRNDMRDWRHGITPPAPQLPPQAQPQQPGPPQGFPPQANRPIPANMLGNSYGVQGMTPGASSFDLPTY